MTVLAFIPHPDKAETIVAWSNVLRDEQAEIEYICFEQEGLHDTAAAVRAAFEDQTASGNITSISSPTPVAELIERCRRAKPELLITAGFSLPEVNGRPQTSEELVREAPCMVISSMHGHSILPKAVRSILMIVSRGAHDFTALRITQQLRTRLRAEVTLATVEDESGTKAERAGERAIRALVHDAGLEAEQFDSKVVVDRLRPRGILSCCEGQDLIVCGTDLLRYIKPLRQSLRDTTLVVKRAPPLRLKSLVEWLPRINPSDHADLLSDLRQGSRWNSDFVFMLALASAIASLGLMQNSPAVVIGSMLLAPLMTPMIGAGLALAQANIQLAKNCTKSIALGLLLTLAVSFLLGTITPSRETLSPEVISRGSPNVLDLLIALFAAIAATIAMARPNIAGAVAGVAIATALVPPLCAVGLSLSLGKFSNALGALLLFGTNLIAIIVASSYTFSLLGILTVRSLTRHRRAVGWGRWGLVTLLIFLAGPLSLTLLSQLEQGRSQTAVFPVTRDVAEALRIRVGKDPGVEITFMGRSSVMEAVVIHIASNHDLPRSYGNDLRAIVRNEMADPELLVYIVCMDGQWMSDTDDPVSGAE